MGVGVLLTSFGTFWAGEGVGAHWPGGDIALLGILAWVLLMTGLSVLWLRSKTVVRA